MTVYIGSPKSERLLRIYNEHGFTRVELQLRDKWSNNAFALVVGSPVPGWYDAALSVLLNFIRFNAFPGWDEFVGCSVPAEIRVYSARNRSLNKIKDWIARQVAPAMFTLYAVGGLDEFWQLVACNVSARRLEKYRLIIELAGGNLAQHIKPMQEELL